MKPTKIEVRRNKGTSAILAFVDITFDNTLVVRGFRLVRGKNGIFLAHPSRKGNDGKFYNITTFVDEGESESAGNIYKKRLEEIVLEKAKEVGAIDATAEEVASDGVPF